jgi:hypothetical protein
MDLRGCAHVVPQTSALHHRFGLQRKTRHNISRGKYRLAAKQWDVAEIITYSSRETLGVALPCCLKAVETVG